jgi:LytS/YehU family sensor histidine kinase
MKPHFLFNCLNVIDNLIMESPTQASEAIGKLADLYRYILKGAKQHFWPLDDEVNLVVDALDLQKIRFQEKIEYSIEIDEQIEKAEVFVPCLMLHTLVENAVKHAVLENPDGGWIKIKILKANVGYEVKVIDTGPGEFVNLKSKKAGTGTGLENTRQRLFRIYGDKARFTVRLDSNGSEVNFWISGRKS